MLYTGKVKFFNSQPDKLWGFIIPDKPDYPNQEIFFHLFDGRFIFAGKTEPQFEGGTRLSPPEAGLRVVFQLAPGSKGVKASPWGHESDYKAAKEAIEKRPLPVQYRVVSWFITVSDGQPTEPKVDWTGSDLNDRVLEKHFHPLFDRHGGNGDIEWRKKWQKSVDGGKTWIDCPCPKQYSDQFDRKGRRTIPSPRR